ncbi:MAG: GNAT family N-acetyltransferase, partial [Vicinamibacterales bacterium]
HAETQAVWCGQAAVSAFTRFHPILKNQQLVPGADGIHPVGTTVSMDLRMTSAEVMLMYPRVLRQEIQAGRRAGLRTEEDRSWAELPTFARLYHETMARNRADSTYLFAMEDLARLHSNLGEGARLLLTRLGDEIVAGGIFLISGSWVHAHLVGTASKHRQLSPLKVLLDDARSWAAEAGAVRLHLGGGRGGRNDSLLAFKARFSPDRHDFAVGRWVLDAIGYEALLRLRATHLGDQPVDGEFFPAYRAGVTPSQVERETS